MFINTYYDYKTNHIYHWYINKDTNNRNFIKEKLEFDYYVDDSDGDYKDIYGNRKSKRTTKDLYKINEIKNSKIEYAESDLKPDIKYLQQKYGGKDFGVDISKINICNIDIECESTQFPDPEEVRFPINLITIKLTKQNKVITLGNRPYKTTGQKDKSGNVIKPDFYYHIPDEKKLLEKFFTIIKKAKIDILTGWYIHGFDIPYIIRRRNFLKIDSKEYSFSPLGFEKYNERTKEFSIPGVSILDYQKLYKRFTFEPKERYSLQFIAEDELGEGKLDYEGTINDVYNHDWDSFVEYNIQDVLLIDKLENKLKFIELAVTLCYESLTPFDSIFGTMVTLLGYVLNFLHRKDIVLPKKKNIKKTHSNPGGFVFANQGLFKYCVSFDVESLYPNMIMEYNIGPETIRDCYKEGYIKTPLSEKKIWKTEQGNFDIEDVYYERGKGILSEIVEYIFNERKMYKEKMFIKDGLDKNNSLEDFDKKLIQEVKNENFSDVYYKHQQMVRKILINSLYGVLCNEKFHFFNITNAMAITLGGQHLIKFLRKCLNHYMSVLFWKKRNIDFKLNKDSVILIDTDSCYITLQYAFEQIGMSFKNNKDFFEWSNDFVENELEPYLDMMLDKYFERYDVENKINFKREKIASNMLIMAKKKYITQAVADEKKLYIDKPKISVTGAEIKKTDTPLFCRKKLEKIVDDIFKYQDRHKIIKEIRNIKKEFLTKDATEIGLPVGISDYDKYSESFDWYVENGLRFKKGSPIYNKAAINYNFMIKKYNLPYQDVKNGTKIKYVFINDDNKIQAKVVGFINTWPKEFDKYFKIDYDLQWGRTFEKIIERVFHVVGWGDVDLNINKKDTFF